MSAKTIFGDPIKPGWKCSIPGCAEEIGDPSNRTNVTIWSPGEAIEDGGGKGYSLCPKHAREIVAMLEPPIVKNARGFDPLCRTSRTSSKNSEELK
jgi:hypothetical protein